MTEIIYIFIIFLAFFLAYCAEKSNKKSYLFFIVFILSFLAGFRGRTVGTDTIQYYVNIERGFPYPWMFREEGFRLLCNICSKYLHNPQMVFVFCAIVTNGLIIYRFWDFKEKTKFSTVVLFYLLIYYGNSLNIMRQYVSVAIVFFATRYLASKKYILFACLLCVAFLFHRSSLLAIGILAVYLWFDMSKRQKQIFVLPMIGLMVLSSIFIYVYLKTDIASYSAQNVNNLNLTFFYRLLIFILAVYLTWTNKRIVFGKLGDKKDIEQHIDPLVTACVLVGLLFEALSMFFAFVGRTGLCYMIFEPVFWGMVTYKTKNKTLFVILFSIFAFYYFALFVLGNSCNVFPYSIYFY